MVGPHSVELGRPAACPLWLSRNSIAKVSESMTAVPCDIAVRLLAILVVVFVLFTSQALLDQRLWKVMAGCMIAKEPFC
jgi:hypothetical protein